MTIINGKETRLIGRNGKRCCIEYASGAAYHYHTQRIYKLQERRTGFLCNIFKWKTLKIYYHFNSLLKAYWSGEIPKDVYDEAFNKGQERLDNFKKEFGYCPSQWDFI